MNHATLRDFFLVAPLIYEAVGRLAVQNFRVGQMEQLKACQKRFRAAIVAGDPEAMVVENNVFHATIGAMAHSVFLQPSLNKLLIDHARIGHTFFRPRNKVMQSNLATACEHHDQFIVAIGERDEPAVVRTRAAALGAVSLGHGIVHRAEGPGVGRHAAPGSGASASQSSRKGGLASLTPP